jgi:hypothetical protein
VGEVHVAPREFESPVGLITYTGCSQLHSRIPNF